MKGVKMMSVYKNKLNAIMEKERRKDKKTKAERERYMAESNMLRAKKEKLILQLVSGEKKYEEWLKGYVEKGGEITHFYDYKCSNIEFYFARKNIHIPQLCGSLAFHVVMDHGCEITCGPEGIGHVNVYYLDGFRIKGSWVPAFKDFLK